MIFSFFIFAQCEKENINSYDVLRQLHSNWTGRGISSSNDLQDSYIFSNFSLNCYFNEDDSYLHQMICSFLNNSTHASINYLIRSNASFINVYSEENDLIISNKVFLNQNNKSFIMKGEINEKRYFTTLYDDILTISIADKFKSNITLLSFNKINVYHDINIVHHLFKVFILIIIISFSLYFIYKKSDLSSFIKPEEGEEAMKIKNLSIAKDKKHNIKIKTD